MHPANVSRILVENSFIQSGVLKREVKIDFYRPQNVTDPDRISLLLINDGQDLLQMDLENILEQLYAGQLIKPVLCVGIHCRHKPENGIWHGGKN